MTKAKRHFGEGAVSHYAIEPRRPTREEVRAAEGRQIPDLIAEGLEVLFCGINPGLYSAALGHHFARPGNRFWRVLHAAGFSERLLAPWEGGLLLKNGFGITDLVPRATATADDLTEAELIAGRQRLARKVARFKPRWVAILGVGAYRAAFSRSKATIGRQTELLGSAGLWVLPNPSARNAAYQLAKLTDAFRAIRKVTVGPRRQ
jgi:double-stranded uracil-DNA glycosylase